MVFERPNGAMKIAIPHWQGRVSPVFDVAGTVLVIEMVDGAESSRKDVGFETEDPHGRAMELARTGVDVLVCGAISRPLERAVQASGIEVIPQTCGDVNCVLEAFGAGRLGAAEFLMPGCCGRRREQRMPGRHGRRGMGRGCRSGPRMAMRPPRST